MVRKGWKSTRRGGESPPETNPSLPQDRLALVHRYMTGERDLPESHQPVVVVPPPEEPAEESHGRGARSRAVEHIPREPSAAVTSGGPTRAGKKAALSERWAAAKAARSAAAAEKREARERKALAKAAARRRT